MADAIIFDIDGTLIDSVDFHARAWQETFARYGIETTFEAVRGQIGKGGDQLMPVFLPKEMLDEKGDEIEKERGEYFRAEYLPLVKPFPQVRELFERLIADGKRIVLASSGSRKDVESFKKLARIDDLIESDTTSDDAEKSKPHPDIFLAALEKLGNPGKATVLVIGDTPYDAVASVKAGVRPVGVLCGGFAEADLRGAGCVSIFRDPADLLARIGEWAES